MIENNGTHVSTSVTFLLQSLTCSHIVVCPDHHALTRRYFESLASISISIQDYILQLYIYTYHPVEIEREKTYMLRASALHHLLLFGRL